MEDPGVYLLMIGGLFLLGAVGEIIFARTQIPDVVWLILAGVVLRATGAVDPAQLEGVLPLFSALTLIIVLFDGGRQLVIDDLVRAAPKASALALLSFTLSTLGVALFLQLMALTGLLPESWGFFHCLMVGAMVGGSSSLIIMPSMNLAKVEGKVSNLVGLESALTDALCVVVAVVMMKIIVSGEASGSATLVELGKNFGIALGIGLLAGWGWVLMLRVLAGSPYAYPVTLTALLFLYVIADRTGGNPAMCVLTFSVIVGNADALMKRLGFKLGDQPLQLDDDVVTVHTQAAFIIKSFFFTYIGLMLAPPWSLLFLGVVVGALLLATRIPAVMLIARKPEFEGPERKMVMISLPRGMAAGVLATLPATMGIADTKDLPAMVFAAVVTSIAIFAVGFRQVRAETAAETVEVSSADADTTAEAGGELPEGEAPPAALPEGMVAGPPSPAEDDEAGLTSTLTGMPKKRPLGQLGLPSQLRQGPGPGQAPGQGQAPAGGGDDENLATLHGMPPGPSASQSKPKARWQPADSGDDSKPS